MMKKIITGTLALVMIVSMFSFAPTYVANAAGNQKTTNGTTSATQQITKKAKVNSTTKEDALAIALEDAGYTEDQISFSKVKKDFDDGMEVWEVEFYVDCCEYNYDIDVASGTIVDFDIDD